MKKRLLSLILALVLALAAPAAAAFLEQSEDFYIADYAGVLSEDLKDDIYWTNYEELYEYCDGAEIVVVTVDNTGGMNTEDYCYKVFNEWGIGGDENNGVLILLSVYDKKYFTMVGKNLESDLDADVLYKLQSGAFEEAFDAGRYDDAVETLFQGCLEVVRAKFAANYEGAGEQTGGNSSLADTIGLVLIGILFVIVLAVIISSISSGVRQSASGRTSTSTATNPWFWWSMGRRSARGYRPPPPPPPRGTSGYSGSRGSGGMFGGGSFGRPSSGSSSSRSFSGSFRSSSSGRSRSSGGGRRSSGGGRSRGGGSGRR